VRLPLRRRDFLKLALFAATGAKLSTLTGCEDGETGARVFPQGVASGDPRSDRVVLWTRIAPLQPDADEVCEFELATDEAFREVVARGPLLAAASADHTTRVLVTALDPATRYFYRFAARGVFSTVGKTKTAPTDDADVAVRFAFTSCQDFVGRYFHPWAALADEGDLDFVVFLGDYIYETDRTPPARIPTADRQTPLPDGLPLGEAPDDGTAALTLADYRTLYRTYRTDPDLQKIHAAVPFINIWDDHEFSNDCWQDRTYYFDGAQGDEQRTAAREAATRAWFEYLPVDLSFNADAGFPNDIITYRTLRYGRHVDLFLTDDRYYRDAHLIQPGPPDPAVGKTASNTMLGARTFVLKEPFDTLEAAAKPTMLVLGRLADVENFVVLSGDLHGFYAATLREDFDGDAPPTAVEYVVSSISAPTLQEQLEAALEVASILAAAGLDSIVSRSDQVLLASNPHMVHSDSATHGYALVEVDLDQELRVELVTFADVTSAARPPVTARHRFRTPSGTPTIERMS
jgi:alkaline phosphatase D